MNKIFRFLLFFLGTAIVVILLAATALYFCVDLNQYKPRIEKAASKALNREVRINGKISLSATPHIGASIRNIHVRNGPGFSKGDLLSIQRVQVALEIEPLLHREFRVKSVRVINPVIRIEQNAKGVFNFEQPPKRKKSSSKKPDLTKTKQAFLSLEIVNISVSNGNLTFVDRKSKRRSRLQGFNISIKNPQLSDAYLKGNQARGLFNALVLKGHLTAKAFRCGDLKLFRIITDFSTKGGKIRLEPMRYTILGSEAKGSLSIDTNRKRPFFRIEQTIPKLNLQRTTKRLLRSQILRGYSSIDARVSATGSGSNDIIRSLKGQVVIRGSNCRFCLYDIDKILERYDKTQNIDLVDLGAVLLSAPLGFAAPLALLATKGFDAAKLGTGIGSGQSQITQFISEWKISNGIAFAKDVAIATKKNRIALKGRLNLIRREFDHVVVAVVDEKGYAKYSQKITGRFDNPQFDKDKLTTQSLTGMFTSIFKKAKRLFVKRKGKPFYRGSIAHPTKK